MVIEFSKTMQCPINNCLQYITVYEVDFDYQTSIFFKRSLLTETLMPLCQS